MTPLQKTELAKLATDAGFDRPAVVANGWLVVRSSHFAEAVELTRIQDGSLRARIENAIRSRDLLELEGVRTAPSSDGAGVLAKQVDVVGIASDRALSALLEFISREAIERRNSPLLIFRAKTRGLPDTTEVERLTIQRIGQDVFRASLIEHWGGECAVTGCDIRDLLRASHIKPWAKCASVEERLDPCNGLLLSAAWDAAFDAGLVTFSDDGVAIVSERLSESVRESLGIHAGLRLRKKLQGHHKYLSFHRNYEFKPDRTGDR